MRKFKVGDKVRLLNTHSTYTRGLKAGEVYEVSHAYIGRGVKYSIKVIGGPEMGALSTRYELVKLSNEERIAKRMEELNEQV